MISVVIPTRNRQRFVRELVDSLLAGSKVPDEIVVVDQSDETAAALAAMTTEKRCSIVYRHSRLRGSSAARNEGIRTARGDVVAFLDDDIIVTPSWLATVTETLAEEDPRTVVTGRVHSGEPETEGGFAPSLKIDVRRARYEGRAAANVLWTNNMAMPRSAVEEVGFFDERLGPGTRRFPGGGEDNDFCFRLLEAGHRIVYEPRALVLHRAWRPKRDYVGLRWRYGRGQGGFYGKHLSLRDRYILNELIGQVVRLGADAARDAFARPRVALGSAAYAAGIVTAAAEWLITQRLLRTGRGGALGN